MTTTFDSYGDFDIALLQVGEKPAPHAFARWQRCARLLDTLFGEKGTVMTGRIHLDGRIQSPRPRWNEASFRTWCSTPESRHYFWEEEEAEARLAIARSQISGGAEPRTSTAPSRTIFSLRLLPVSASPSLSPIATRPLRDQLERAKL